MAKLVARVRFLEKKSQIKEKASIYEILNDITKNVLLGSIKPKPGMKVENVIDNIIHKVLGT